MQKKLKSVLLVLAVISNITFILSGMLLTFWIINTMNSAMEFLSNPVTLILMAVLFALSFVASPVYVAVYVLLLRADKHADETAGQS